MKDSTKNEIKVNLHGKYYVFYRDTINNCENLSYKVILESGDPREINKEEFNNSKFYCNTTFQYNIDKNPYLTQYTLWKDGKPIGQSDSNFFSINETGNYKINAFVEACNSNVTSKEVFFEKVDSPLDLRAKRIKGLNNVDTLSMNRCSIAASTLLNNINPSSVVFKKDGEKQVYDFFGITGFRVNP
jgi:hypothetical protein